MNKIRVDAILHIENRLLFLMLVQTLALEFAREEMKGNTLAASILAEAMCIPGDILPSDPRILYNWALDYVCFGIGKSSAPAWFKREWVGSEW